MSIPQTSTSQTTKDLKTNERSAGVWQLSIDNLKDRMQHVFKNKTLSDCQFEICTKSSTKIFNGHKIFLAISSPVFEAMLYGLMAENKPIVIKDIEPEIFETLLEYIYTDNVNIKSFEIACDLYYAAKKYMLPFLQKKCVQFLETHANCQNACKGFEFSRLHEELSLMEKCLNIINNQTTNVLTTANLNNVDLHTFITIANQTNLNIQSEIILFNALQMYADNISKDNDETESMGENSSNEPIKHNSFLRNELKKIRFLTMTPQQFTEGPMLSNLLTEEEKLAIIANISSPNCAIAMPIGFSTCRTFRNPNNKEQLVQQFVQQPVTTRRF